MIKDNNTNEQGEDHNKYVSKVITYIHTYTHTYIQTGMLEYSL